MSDLAVIDLRAICNHREDHANAIEPSSVGGAKIARAIAALATDVDSADEPTRRRQDKSGDVMTQRTLMRHNSVQMVSRYL